MVEGREDDLRYQKLPFASTSSPSFSLSCVTKNGRVKSWGRVLLAPGDFTWPFFSSRFSFASRKTDKAKEGLLVAYSRKETLYNVHCMSIESIDQILTLLAPHRLSLVLSGFEEFLGHSTP